VLLVWFFTSFDRPCGKTWSKHAYLFLFINPFSVKTKGESRQALRLFLILAQSAKTSTVLLVLVHVLIKSDHGFFFFFVVSSMESWRPLTWWVSYSAILNLCSHIPVHLQLLLAGRTIMPAARRCPPRRCPNTEPATQAIKKVHRICSLFLTEKKELDQCCGMTKNSYFHSPLLPIQNILLI